jgi:signal recognition particle subunit SRP54
MQESCKTLSASRLTKKSLPIHEKRLRNALLEADVTLSVANTIARRAIDLVNQKSTRATPAQLSAAFIELLKDILHRPLPRQIGPSKIMMVGPNGAGKTTSTAKLARFLSARGSVAVVACDLCRPAALAQLQKMVENAPADFYALDPARPAESLSLLLPVVGSYKSVIFDTAGKQDNSTADFEELSKISAVTKPDWKLLVCDASGGQQISSLAKFFMPLGIDASILTKTDGDALGGAALSMVCETGRPIIFCGTGERLEDFEEFDAARMAARIMGRGDLAAIAARAELQESIRDIPDTGPLDFNTMLSLTTVIEGMGGMSWISRLLPGNMGAGTIDASSGVHHIKAMIMSMTNAERANPALLECPSRIERIAAGSGFDEGSVKELAGRLKVFNQALPNLSLPL